MRTNFLRLFRLAGIAPMLILVLFAGTACAADEHEDGPQSLIITYHTTPSERVALRNELEKSGVRQFQHWKEHGLLKNFSLLFNRYVDSGNWDAMALLTFSNYADLERWKKIERTNPAGVSKKTLALAPAIHTAPADLMRNNGATGTSENSVFMVIPYETMVSTAEYLKYADGDVIPQFEGWMQEGILS